ncbi:hypothetical protein [Microbacterium deminutum]|uniref:Collagen-like protein n=1 Tax=Microbacterium deminutum TaxID=344164 RepID=A0ABN2REE8_9MICO
MSDGQTTPNPTAAPAAPEAPPPAGVSRAALIWIGVGVVVLSFVAAFLGSWLARSVDTAAEPQPAPTSSATPTTTPSETPPPDYQAIVEDLLPAGSAVRAGTGAPQSGKGYKGDVYIDRSNADVYVFEDDWVWVGNIKANAAENLTGEQGPAGTPGAPGAPGAPGTAGTQVLLGVGAPDDQTCQTDGDVYIDTAVNQYYQCESGTWTLFGPTAEQLPAPTPTDDSGSNG